MPETLDGDFLQTYLELAPQEQALVAEQALHENQSQDAFKTTSLVSPEELRLILTHLKC
jgi:hypothetical protein